MSERDNAHGHKTHRSLIVDHPYERHIKPILDHEPFSRNKREKFYFAISTIRGRVSQDGETYIM